MPRDLHFKVKDLTFKEKAMFAKFTIAASGSFHNSPRTRWNDTNLTRWITLRGGRYHKSPTITREVTHFVTDEHELQSRSPNAVEALRNKHIQIVPLEWLEFSMINKKVLPIVSGGEYDFRDKLRKEAEKEKRLKKEAVGMLLGGRAVNTSLYRVYTDATFFRYEVDIFRDSNVGQGVSPQTSEKQQAVKVPLPTLSKDISELDFAVKHEAGIGLEHRTPTKQQLLLSCCQLSGSFSNNHEAGIDAEVEMNTEVEPKTPTKAARTDRGEKYTVTLYESIATPPLYFFCAKYSKSSTDTLPKYYRPSETPQLFWTEYTHFIEFFHKKTGVEWQKRLLFCGEGKAPVGIKRKGKERKVDDGEGVEGLERGWFKYTSPTGGKPVGWVPEEYVPREELEGDKMVE
ncbi:hypothetical protein QBC36DRAFT_358500 [Triangularia setosa]|uniref:BRCT domain-containing protein n=1 Tax=Triangularia setosa TaxID=2587417 RepID=A0AAN6W5H8_9PEZI|nr:hypothetical protein QBC36DRAFT_358500 [Podospora setosa]